MQAESDTILQSHHLVSHSTNNIAYNITVILIEVIVNIVQ